jgi:hypothetical protein
MVQRFEALLAALLRPGTDRRVCGRSVNDAKLSIALYLGSVDMSHAEFNATA